MSALTTPAGPFLFAVACRVLCRFALAPPLCGSLHTDQCASADAHRPGRASLTHKFKKHVVGNAVRGTKFADAVTARPKRRSRALGISSPRASPKRSMSARATAKRREWSRTSRPPCARIDFANDPPRAPQGRPCPAPRSRHLRLPDSRRGNRRVPGRRRRSDAGSHGRRGGLRRLPRFRRALAWDRVGVADFVLWEGMFSEQKSVPKKHLEQKFSFWSHSSAG